MLFSDEQHLLFATMSESLGASDKSIKEKIGELLSDYAGVLGTLTQFVGAGTDGLEKLGNTLKNTSIEKLKKGVDDLIIQSGKNIVIFVDDIDRLDVNEIQYVFKLVKLVSDFLALYALLEQLSEQ
jgi:predicted KAP-like P-loop ATPase